MKGLFERDVIAMGKNRVFLAVMVVLCACYAVSDMYITGVLLMPMLFATVCGAMVRDRTPVGKAGMFQGLRIVGQVLVPGVVGPAIGAAVLKNAETIANNDGTSSFIPNQNIFLAALAVIAVLAIALIPIIRLLKKEKTDA